MISNHSARCEILQKSYDRVTFRVTLSPPVPVVAGAGVGGGCAVGGCGEVGGSGIGCDALLIRPSSWTAFKYSCGKEQ